ncbi:hypothetical protein HNY73_020864 [Argiope bruennichi]|uniref:Uncharacterized protein n=1 Tax=Argiope bruennichi TaxID=94029 RepID=A0A8T0E9A2_ARGBR|nr:hypothetical protein HNY73_020864 [Argiope bruennichi]
MNMSYQVIKARLAPLFGDQSPIVLLSFPELIMMMQDGEFDNEDNMSQRSSGSRRMIFEGKGFQMDLEELGGIGLLVLSLKVYILPAALRGTWPDKLHKDLFLKSQVSSFNLLALPEQFGKFLQKIQSRDPKGIEFNTEINIGGQDILPTRFMPIPSKFKVYIIDGIENRMEISTAFIRKTIFSSNVIQNELCRDAVKSDIDPERIRGHPPKLKDFCTLQAVMDDALMLHQSAHFMSGKSITVNYPSGCYHRHQ